MTETRAADAASRSEAGTPNPSLAHASRALEVIRWLRRLDEEELAASPSAGPGRRAYPEAVDLVPWSYLETDLDGVIIQASLATGAMLGVSREGLIGTSLVELVAPESIKVFTLALKRLQQEDDATGWEMRVQPSTDPPLNVFVEARGGRDPQGNRVLWWLLHEMPGERGRRSRRARRRPSSMVNRRRRSGVGSKSG